MRTVALLLTLLTSRLTDAQSADSSMAFRDVTVITMTGAPTLEHATVLVQGEVVSRSVR